MNVPTKRNHVWPTGAVLISATLWGSIWMPLHAVSEAGLPGPWIALLVCALPAAVLAPIACFRRSGSFTKHGRHLAAVGILNGVCNVLYATAVIQGEVATVVLLFYLNPVWSALMERAILQTPISQHRLLSIVLGLSGLWILIADGSGIPVPASVSEWSALAAGVFWAAALVAMGQSGHVPLIDRAFAQYFFAVLAAAVLIAANVFQADIVWERVAWPAAFTWLVVVAFVWELPGLLLATWGAAYLSPTRASVLFMVEALVGVGTAVLWAGGAFGLREVIGGLLVVSAGVIDQMVDTTEKRKARSVSAVAAEFRETLAKWLAVAIRPQSIWRPAFVAACVVIVGLGALLYVETSIAQYFTASGAEKAPSSGPTLIVTFRSTATVVEISTILRDLDATIVDGPKPGGAFIVQFPTLGMLDAAERAFLVRSDLVASIARNS